jgi:NADP-dependent 3-hydroxy acid dehydrogenase YdfG
MERSSTLKYKALPRITQNSYNTLNMPFPFKHVLLIGATSGIGQAMADHFIARGIMVTAVGRRTERLEEFVAQHGNDKASAITFDIEKLDAIPAFIEK